MQGLLVCLFVCWGQRLLEILLVLLFCIELFSFGNIIQDLVWAQHDRSRRNGQILYGWLRDITCADCFLCCSVCGGDGREKAEGSKLQQSLKSLLWSENKGRTGIKVLLTPLLCLPSLCPIIRERTHSESSSCALQQTSSKSQVYLSASVKWKGYNGRTLVILQDHC